MALGNHDRVTRVSELGAGGQTNDAGADDQSVDGFQVVC
jgi:hypothetical protein